MKIKLCWTKSEDPEDFTEVVPYEDNLDQICENGEAVLILAENIVDHLKQKEVREFLPWWTSKLRHGGTLIVSGLDLSEVVRLYYNGVITLDQANDLLFKGGTAKSIHTGDSVWKMLKNSGLKINKFRYAEGQYLLEATRP